MFRKIAALVRPDSDFPARTNRLDILRRVLNGTLYDVLNYSFHEETDSSGQYISISKRRPSVRWNLCRIAVQDAVALLFGEERFPVIDAATPDVTEKLASVIADAKLPAVMIEAALRGSIGSVAVGMKVLKGRVFFTVNDTLYLTPEWDAQEPDMLAGMVETFKLKGRELKAAGYPIDDGDAAATFWVRREWDDQDETWFLPQTLSDKADGKLPVIDAKRSVKHALGFVPWVWVKNLPGGDDIDGASTFEAAINTQIELEYLLSQGGRGLKYSSEPTLMIKDPSMPEGAMVHSPANALIVSADGDAKLLEINGTASAAVVEYARLLRNASMEQVGGSRADPDKLAATMSGRAMEMLNQPLIWLADKLRGSYGDAVLDLARMVVMASAKYALRTKWEQIGKLPAGKLALRWPEWFPPTSEDKQAQAVTLTTLVGGELMARDTAISIIGPTYDISDVEAEKTSVDADAASADKRAADQAMALAKAEPKPGAS